jgi:hypothetical protein
MSLGALVEPDAEPVPDVSLLLEDPALPGFWSLEEPDEPVPSVSSLDPVVLPVELVPCAPAGDAAARIAAAPRPAIVPHSNHFMFRTLRRSCGSEPGTTAEVRRVSAP